MKAATVIVGRHINLGTFLVMGGIAIGIGGRLLLAYNFYGNYDQVSFEIVSGIMLRGGNVYAETERYNYTPLWAYILLALRLIADSTNLPFHFVVRSFLSVIDLINASILAMLTNKRTTIFLIALLNPVSILLTGYHGQFENLAACPLLLAMYLKPRLPQICWFLGTTSLIIKHIIAFNVWTLFIYTSATARRALVTAIFAVCIFFLTFIPFVTEGWVGILHNVLLYTSVPGYGIGLLRRFGVSQYALVVPFIAIMTILPIVGQKVLRLSLVEAMQLTSIAFITLIPGFGVQYLIIPIIFGSLTPSVPYAIYSAISTLILIGHHSNLSLLPINTARAPFITTIFVVSALWLMYYLYLHRTKKPFTE